MTDGPSTVSRAVRVALAVALLGAVAGCLGAGSGASTTATATATSTPNTDCPPALTVTEIDTDRVDGDSAVAYENLTTEQRATFDRARNGSAVEGFDDAWRDIDRVEYEGRYYNVGIIVC